MSIQQNEKQTTKAIISFSPRQALEQANSNAIIVDIRPEYETSYRVFDVPRVIYLQYCTYRKNFSIIPNDTLVIVADCAGIQSKEVAHFLMEQGYKDVACLVGGIIEWDRYGLPLLKDVDYEMIGGCACRLHPQKSV